MLYNNIHTLLRIFQMFFFEEKKNQQHMDNQIDTSFLSKQSLLEEARSKKQEKKC